MTLREQQLAQELNDHLAIRDELRNRQRSIQNGTMGSIVPSAPGGAVNLPDSLRNPRLGPLPARRPMTNTLQEALARFLPPELMPSNVGKISETAYFYLEPANFDFGVNPTLNSFTVQQVNITIPKDGGFLLLNTTVSGNDFSPAGLGGPYTILIKDNQSAQQFMDNPVPLQMLAYKSKMRQMVTPMYFAPSATISITIGTWLPQGVFTDTIGSGKLQVLLTGLLTNVTSDQSNLSNVYSCSYPRGGNGT